MTTYQKIIYAIGCATLVVLVVLAVFAGFDLIDQHINHQELRRGYVISKSHDDGHYWYSSWEIGDYSITKRHGGQAYYFVEVQDGDEIDFWRVSQERWDALKIGDYILR